MKSPAQKRWALAKQRVQGNRVSARRKSATAPDSESLERAVQVLSAISAMRRKQDFGAAQRAAIGTTLALIIVRTIHAAGLHCWCGNGAVRYRADRNAS